MAAETQLHRGLPAALASPAAEMARPAAERVQAAMANATVGRDKDAWPALAPQPDMEVPGLGQPGRPDSSERNLHPTEILRRCVAVGLHPSQLRADVVRLLRGGGLRGSMDLAGLRRRFWTLQLALACIEEAPDDEALALMLLPIEGISGDRDELASTLRDSLLGERDEHLEAWMREMTSSSTALPSTGSARSMLLEGSRNPQRLGACVKDFMRLPDQEARTISSVEWNDQLREIEATETAATLLAELNAAAEALADDNPCRFSRAYVALNQSCDTFLDVIRLLAPLYALGELPGAMERLKAALAADLAAAVPSRDRRRIQWILGRMSTMHLSSTLVEALQQFLMPLARKRFSHD